MLKYLLPLKSLSVVGLLLLVTGSAVAEDKIYYRYVNDEGVKVLNARVPPQFVKNGYEVVTITGRVLEVVPPAPSEQEKAALAEQRAQEARLAEWDESLRRRYSSVADIEAAKERKLADFDANLLILQGNANSISAEIDKAQAQAANYERSGRDVPAPVLGNIQTLKEKLQETQAQMEVRQLERTKAANEFELDVERFREINPGS